MDKTPGSIVERALKALLANPFDASQPGLAHIKPGAVSRDEAYAQLAQAASLAHQAPKKSWTKTTRWAWALMIYPELIDDLDAHIAQPAACAQELGWAQEAFAKLRRGLDRQQSAWWLGLFYQWRRAWRLIHEQLVGQGPSMQRLRATVWACCFGPSLEAYERGLWQRLSELGLWVEGAPGAGHEQVARVLAASQWRAYDERRGCFEQLSSELIVVDLEGLTALEQEALLFGHRKGALLPKSSIGALERAQPGQLIWIEGLERACGALQLKLARAQQQRRFMPAGSDQALELNARMILSLKRSAADLIDEGELLSEAYYKLGAACVALPPLSARLREAASPQQELAQLIAALCADRIDAQAPDHEHIAQTLISALGPDYAWPGNLHELTHAIAQVELLGSYQISDARQATTSDVVDAQALAMSLVQGEISIKELTERYCVMLYEQLGTYEAVAARTGLDRRTVKKYIHP